MNVVRRHTRRRWLAVSAAALVVLAIPPALRALPVSAPRVELRSLVARIAGSAAQPYSGYALSSGTAGLPSLPRLGEVVSLLNGETQLRVWYASAEHWRVDLIGTGQERDVYALGMDEWVWDYGDNQLVVVSGPVPVRLPRGADLLPPDLARRLLAMAGPERAGGASLSALAARRIAGISAAGVRLDPADPRSTVGHVDIWADPATGLPLQVEVTPRGARVPILVSRFLELRLAAPAEAVLTPPEPRPGMGFVVTQTPDIVAAFNSLQLGSLPDRLGGQTRSEGSDALAGVGVYGTGLAQFVALSVPRRTGLRAMDSVRRAGGTVLPFTGGEGAVVSTALLSVLVLNSGRSGRTYVLAGLVDGAVLADAAAELSTYRGRP